MPLGSRWLIGLEDGSVIDVLGAGAGPCSRWCESPLAEVKAVLQKGHGTFLPRWVLEFKMLW